MKKAFRLRPVYLFILLIVLFNSQIFRATNSNPIGLAFVQEGFYLFLIAFSLFYLVSQVADNGGIRKSNLIIFILPLVLWFYGALLAFLSFDQPIVFGLIEERRLFALWVFFPLVWAMRNSYVSYQEIENILLYVALLCCIAILLTATGVISPITEIDTSSSGNRINRYTTGQHFIVIASIILISRMRAGSAVRQLVVLSAFVTTLLLFIQTRQLIVAFIVGFIFLQSRVKLAMIIASLSLIFPLIAIWSTQLEQSQVFRLVQFTFSGEYLEHSWRVRSIETVLMELRGVSIFGHGSLSPLWNDGFSRIYGDYFYLADIGLFGTVYRYGVLGLVLYFLLFVYIFGIIRRLPKGSAKNSSFAIYIIIIISTPVAAPLEYTGFLLGYLLAIVFSLKENDSKHPVALPSNRFRMNKSGYPYFDYD